MLKFLGINPDTRSAAGLAALVLCSAVLTGAGSAQSTRPAPVVIPPAEMPVVVTAENGRFQCLDGQFTAIAMEEDGKPMIYPVHLGAGDDYLALDTARAGAPAIACDTAVTAVESLDEAPAEQRWIGVVYGGDLKDCSITRTGAYTGPCRYGWVLEGFFEIAPGADASLLAVIEGARD